MHTRFLASIHIFVFSLTNNQIKRNSSNDKPKVIFGPLGKKRIFIFFATLNASKNRSLHTKKNREKYKSTHFYYYYYF